MDYFLVDGGDWFVVRSDTGEVVVNRSLMTLDHNQQLQLVVEARDRGMSPLVFATHSTLNICVISTVQRH